MRRKEQESTTETVEIILFADCPKDLVAKYTAVPYGENIVLEPEEFQRLENIRAKVFVRDFKTGGMLSVREKELVDQIRGLKERIRELKQLAADAGISVES